ncbi:MAG: glycosyltransferase [Tistlia sp.]|uniref:glycosyltransferase family 2 protein n=1 Tax=Tistlia sp. TaxID=3057121 RepID=UPI0034A43C83
MVQVSVVIPCFNAEETIVRALSSVVEQRFEDLEIIVVDDGSSDRTVEAVKSLGLPNLVLAANPGRKGASAARNRGIALAKGAFIAFLDADDAWLPGKLTAQLAALESNPAAVFASSRCIAVKEGTEEESWLYDRLEPRSGPEVWRTLLAYNFIGTPSVVVRREALAQAGPFNEALRVAEDQDLWIRLSMVGDLAFVDRPLVRVYLRAGSLSNENVLWRVENELAMVRRHVATLGSRITPAERRTILGTRYTRVGRHLYLTHPRLGLQLLSKAILQGDSVLPNLAYLVMSSRPALYAKQIVKPMLRSARRSQKIKY